MANAVEVDRLCKVYVKARSLRDLFLRPFAPAERVQALADVRLEVRRGEVFGLLGPNGAGKTTLLKILTGLVAPSSGAARVNGFDVARSHVAVRASIGFMTSEERSFYWRLTGRENLHFFGRLSNVPPGELGPRSQKVMEQVEIADAADRRFMDYSSGMKQRLALARALLHDPPVLIMDEPTRSLDPSAASHLRAFIRESLSRLSGKTILLATHNLEEAELLCGRVAIISRARIRRCGTLPEIRATESPRERYNIRVRPDFTPSGEGYRVVEAVATEDGARLHTIEFERGGDGLTRFLGEALGAGSRVVSCERLELPLQVMFERAVASGDGDAA